MINFRSKIFIAMDIRVLLGSSIFKNIQEKRLQKFNYIEKMKLDLRNQEKFKNFLKRKIRCSNYCCSKSWRN